MKVWSKGKTLMLKQEKGKPNGSALPLPVPWIVRNGFGWTAALFVAAMPLAVLGAGFGAFLERLLARVTGIEITFVSSGLPLLLLASPFWAGLLAGYSRTSSFILECVKWYLDHGEVERAKNLARTLDYQVWYREWKRNPWFRRFVVESGLVETSARYAKFNRRMPAG